jgi:hypothetical protein
VKPFADHFRLRQASVVLLILGLTACSNDPDPEMPTFRGHFSITGTTVSPGEDGSLRRCNANVSNGGESPGFSYSTSTEGTGEFNLLGQVTIVATNCNNPKGDGIAQGRVTLKAASGDVLMATHHGTTSPNTGDPDIQAQRLSFQVVGGTGEFAQAHGTFTCEVRVRISTDEVIGTCQGDVSL